VAEKFTSSIKNLGFIQACGVTLYCGLVGILFWKGNEIFGSVPNYFGPVAFLLLFSVSALVCALLVFYQPYKLFFAGKKKEAIDLVLHTTGWLFALFILFLSIAVIL
jgi:hypothetical protein